MNVALHFQSSCLIKQHNHSWMLVYRPVLNFHLTWRTAQHCSWWIGPHCSERSWLEDLSLDFFFLDSPELKLDPPPPFFFFKPCMILTISPFLANERKCEYHCLSALFLYVYQSENKRWVKGERGREREQVATKKN